MQHLHAALLSLGFLDCSMVKNPPANAADAGLIPGSGRSPGEGYGNPLQYSCLENSMGRGPWGRKESDMIEQLSTHRCFCLDLVEYIQITVILLRFIIFYQFIIFYPICYGCGIHF